MDEIYAKLTSAFEDVFDEDVTLTPETTADDVPGWDSLAHIRLMITVQRAFKVKFTPAEIGGLKTVGDLAALVTRHLDR